MNIIFNVVICILFTVLGQSSCSPLSYLDHFLNESATGYSNKSNLNDSIDSYDRSFDDNKALSVSKSSFSEFNNSVSLFIYYSVLTMFFMLILF